MKNIDEWNLLKKEYFENKIEFDCIEEFVEGLIDELNDVKSATNEVKG